MVDDFPDFLLLLLIFQRFDDAKWGCFAECPQSKVKIDGRKDLLTASFTAGGGAGQETTIGFYQGLLGFPLVELVENRDYAGSSHFFFDLGNDTLLGFFDLIRIALDSTTVSIGLRPAAFIVSPDSGRGSS